ncbi:MAG: hypothetical protein Q3976_03275 [Corynebacterium sp.]|nr:hypothetical protein [Corynebacterium sp.]
MASLFGFRKREDPERTPRLAAELTNTPLDNYMTRLLAEELPMVDSASRQRIYELLADYTGPQITTQEELPAGIRELLDL